MLLVNEVYRSGNRSFRILWLSAEVAYWIDIESKRALSELVKIDDLNSLIKAQTIQPNASRKEL